MTTSKEVKIIYETKTKNRPATPKRQPRYIVEFCSHYGYGWIGIEKHNSKLLAILDAKSSHWATGSPYRVVDTNPATD